MKFYWPKKAIFSEKFKTNKSAVILIALSIYFFLIFARWLITSIVPVLWVELKYQTRQVLKNTFQATTLHDAIFPDFSLLNWESHSKYRDYGIVIPTIYLDEPVVFNVDPNNSQEYKAALKKGIAHASSTAFPDNGGIGYYFAHSSSQELHSQYNAVFYLLGKLEQGDKVYIWHENQRFTYEVYEAKATFPNDVSFLNQAYQQETIVLQTCWPAGTTEKRLLVFAKRVVEKTN